MAPVPARDTGSSLSMPARTRSTSPARTRAATPGGDESGPVGEPGEAVGRERIEQVAGRFDLASAGDETGGDRCRRHRRVPVISWTAPAVNVRPRDGREAGRLDQREQVAGRRQVGRRAGQVVVGLRVVRQGRPDERHDPTEPDVVPGPEQRAGGLGGLEGGETRARSQDARALPEEALEVDEVAECEAADDAVGGRVGNRQRQRVGARQRSGRVRSGRACRRRSRHRSASNPPPRRRRTDRRCRSARSSTVAPGASRSAPTVWRRHRRSWPSEMMRFRRSYRGAMRSNIASTARCLSSPSGRRVVRRRRRRARHGHTTSRRRLASALAASSSAGSPTDSRCSWATSSSTRRKWCADERRDRRKEDSERLDETLGALVVGQVGGSERLADVRVEHRDRTFGGLARRFVVPARQRQELRHRQTCLEETQPGGDDRRRRRS